MSNTKQVLTQKSARGIREISKLENVTEGYIIISDKQNVPQLMTEILTTEQAKDFIRDNRYRYQNCTFDFKYEVVEEVVETNGYSNIATACDSSCETEPICTTNYEIGSCHSLSKEDFIKAIIDGFVFSDVFGNKLYYNPEAPYPFRLNNTVLNNFHQFDSSNIFKVVSNIREREEHKYKVYKGNLSFEVVTKYIDIIVMEMNLDKYELIGE